MFSKWEALLTEPLLLTYRKTNPQWANYVIKAHRKTSRTTVDSLFGVGTVFGFLSSCCHCVGVDWLESGQWRALWKILVSSTMATWMVNMVTNPLFLFPTCSVPHGVLLQPVTALIREKREHTLGRSPGMFPHSLSHLGAIQSLH